MEFKGFPKIPRINKEIIVTEKIDGTNAQILIEFTNIKLNGDIDFDRGCVYQDQYHSIKAGSRNRWITPENDNFGFAKWVKENANEIAKLGVGTHYGEWFGKGIQRGYGLEEKRFALFNAHRWTDAYKAMKEGHDNAFPKCCTVVPIIAQATVKDIDEIMASLKEHGSHIAPGFMNPEGIVIYHTGSGQLYKDTFEDREGKWVALKDGFAKIGDGPITHMANYTLNNRKEVCV